MYKLPTKFFINLKAENKRIQKNCTWLAAVSAVAKAVAAAVAEKSQKKHKHK